MKFGICTTCEKSPLVKAAGWDYIEENVQGLLQGLSPDNEWKGLERARASALPVLAANVLVPATLKITGPEADLAKLREYMTRVLKRAALVGIKTLVFGSGGARNVPAGFDRQQARQQIIDFLKMAAPIAQANGIVLVAEHLNRKECNIINSLREAMEYVRAVNHPSFRCLVDSYHFWLEDEPLESLTEAMQYIHHVHLADKEGRVPPGESGGNDYRPLFHILKQGGYDGPMSVEAGKFEDIAGLGKKVLAFLKRQWEEA